LGFFGRLNPINVKVSVLLDKPTFLEGETITGRVVLNSDEAVHVDEIRLEIRVTESFYTRKTVWSSGHASETTVRETNSLHSEDVTKGFKDEFPFSINLPPVRPTMPNGVIDREIKGVVAVKGRPDKTQEITVNVSPAAYGSVAAQAPAQVMVKEIIKVPCKYCGALVPVESSRCTNCGAKFAR